MLAVLVALLAAVAGLPASGVAVTEAAAMSAEAEWLAGPADDCCDEVAADAPSGPCVPGDSCPPAGGCCACVACGKRVADTPPLARAVGSEDVTRHRVLSEGPTGIDEVGAVWHPPQG